MANQPSHEDANLILKLYELRREPRMREARNFVGGQLNANTLEEFMAQCPPGSDANASVRMVASYWEMAASFVTSGVLNKELFLQSNGELLFVWTKIQPFVTGMRQFTKNPGMFSNLEAVANDYIAYMNSKGPEAYAAFKAMVESMSAARSAKQAQ